jgi:Flp pilus assembly protein TadG
MNRIRKTLSTLSRWRSLSRWSPWRDRRGVAAVEFALIAPLAIAAFFGEFTLCESYTINRKVTIAARTITDLIARQYCVNASDVTTYLNASAQIAAPYSTSNMVVTVAELATDANSNTTVTWSQSYNGTALTAGASFTPEAGVAQPSSNVIYGYVRYRYTPPVGYLFTGHITISDKFYMYPRNTTSVPLQSSSICTN